MVWVLSCGVTCYSIFERQRDTGKGMEIAQDIRTDSRFYEKWGDSSQFKCFWDLTTAKEGVNNGMGSKTQVEHCILP